MANVSPFSCPGHGLVDQRGVELDLGGGLGGLVLGTFLSEPMALFNHSCDASGYLSCVLRPGRSPVACVKVTRDLAAGDEVTLNYGPVAIEPSCLRVARLEKAYHFTCADRLAAGASRGVDAADAYVAAGSYANHLDAIWRPSFGDENLAVFAAEWFFPAGPDNATDVADAAHRVLVNFLGLRSWSPEALEGRDSLAYGREAWLARKAGDAESDDDAPRWACGDGDLADLAAFYAPQNGRVAGDVARAVATYAMIWDRKFLLARLPAWLTPAPPRRAHYARLQRRLESDGPWV